MFIGEVVGGGGEGCGWGCLFLLLFGIVPFIALSYGTVDGFLAVVCLVATAVFVGKAFAASGNFSDSNRESTVAGFGCLALCLAIATIVFSFRGCNPGAF